MATTTGYGLNQGNVRIDQPPKQARFDLLSDKISEVGKGLEEGLARLRRATDRLGGSEPAGDGGKAVPQAVANGIADQLQDQIGYLGNLVSLFHNELTRLERL